MRNHGRLSLPAIALLLAHTTPSRGEPPRAGRLTIVIGELRNDKGQVGCSLYGSDKGFPTEPSLALQLIYCPIRGATASCPFEPIPAGTYAVACFHDENGNRTFDRSRIGIPVEGNVASNHARGFLGPPRWSKARFEFRGEATDMPLRMGY